MRTPVATRAQCFTPRPLPAHRRAAAKSLRAVGDAGEPASSGRIPVAEHAGAVISAGTLAAFAVAASADPALALTIHTEPANALSLPTWMIHISSVVEWAVAMGLVWRFADATGRPVWKGLSWGMMPCLGSAMCACTWHFFYNSPDLQFLVLLQAALTVVGNCTCWLAAYRIYKVSLAEQQAP